MAPKRKPEAKPLPPPRRTRSATAAAAAVEPAVPPPAKKSKRTAEGRQKGSAAAAKPAVPPPANEPKRSARGKQKGKAKGSDAPAAASSVTGAGDASSKTIIVEADCNQCHRFRKRAEMVKDGLTSGIPGVTVIVNPEKPRRGCFEIRDADGETFVSLLNLVRPFKPLTDLDMDELISDIIDKIK